MNEAIALQAKLSDAESVRFGGIYIEHTPMFRVVVRLVGGAEQLLSRYTSNPLIVAEKAAVPLVALRNKQEAAIKALVGSEPNFGTEVDVRKGRLTIYAPNPDRARTKLKGASLADADTEFVTAEKRDEVVASVRGGEQLTTQTDNAGFYENGTLGFAVVKGTTRGILTAAHVGECISAGSSCVKNSPFTSQGVSFTWQGQMNSGSDDYEWRTVSSGNTITNAIKYSTSSLTVTGTADPTTFPVGTTVCKQGATTGYTCGTIEATNSSTTYNGATGYWVRVKRNTSGYMTDSGDSGGPVFGGGAAAGQATAYGIVHSKVTSPADQVGQMMFMPIKRISGLGLSVATN